MKRRGLSQVVTTVIIILIVLAAIVLIWSAVRPTIQTATEQVNSDCFTINLEAVSCDVDTGMLTVKRNAGDGDVVGVRAIATNVNTGEVEVSDFGGSVPEILGSESGAITFPPANDLNDEFQVDIAAVIANDQVCNPSGRPVTCT